MCSADRGLRHHLLSDVPVVSAASKEKNVGWAGGQVGCCVQLRTAAGQLLPRSTNCPL